MLRRLLLVAGVILGIGCAMGNGSQVDPCKRAFDRLEDECGFTVTVEGPMMDFHCTGQSACLAACLEESPCSEIRHGSGEYAACVSDCQ